MLRTSFGVIFDIVFQCIFSGNKHEISAFWDFPYFCLIDRFGVCLNNIVLGGRKVYVLSECIISIFENKAKLDTKSSNGEMQRQNKVALGVSSENYWNYVR